MPPTAYFSVGSEIPEANGSTHTLAFHELSLLIHHDQLNRIARDAEMVKSSPQLGQALRTLLRQC